MPNPFAPTISTVAGQGSTQAAPKYDQFGNVIDPFAEATFFGQTAGRSFSERNSFLGSFVAHIATASQIAKAASQLPPTPNPSGVFGARIQQPRVGAADLVMPMIPTR